MHPDDDPLEPTIGRTNAGYAAERAPLTLDEELNGTARRSRSLFQLPNASPPRPPRNVHRRTSR